MKPYPPLGLLYLSAWLDRHDVENEVFDSTFSTRTSLFEYLLQTRPSILALYANLMTKLNVLAIMDFIRRSPELKETLVVLGGPDVTHNAEAYLKNGADLIVIGEGEQSLLEIAYKAEALGYKREMKAFKNIAGLALLEDEGQLFKSDPREKLRDIDQLPLPNRHKISLQRYLDAWKEAHGHSSISLSTQRGCPYTCRWCSTAVYGQSYRRRSPEKVVEEIRFLQETYDFDLIWFVDDVFTISHKWLTAFKEALDAARVKVRFECITRADRLSEPVLDTLREAGCFRVWIGAESGSQRVIDAMDRRVAVGQVRNMIRAAREKGMQTGTFIMLGYPGETEADIRETLEHLKISNPDLFTITIAYPIKGTGLYEDVQSMSPRILPWEKSTDRDIDFKREYSRRYYNYAVRWMVNSVRLHKTLLGGRGLSLEALKLRLKVWVLGVGCRLLAIRKAG